MVTVDQVREIVNGYRPDQSKVLEQMAMERGLDVSVTSYLLMLQEEAEFSVRASADEDKESEKSYAADLLGLAEHIKGLAGK